MPLAHPRTHARCYWVISPGDHRFCPILRWLNVRKITVVDGGNERADSVFGRVTGRCKGAVGWCTTRQDPCLHQMTLRGC